MQVLVGEWSSLADRAAVDRNPVEERTRRQIQELLEKILAHVDRRDGVAPNRILQAAVESDRVRAKMDNRSHSAAEKSVIGVAVLYDVNAWEQQASGRQ